MPWAARSVHGLISKLLRRYFASYDYYNYWVCNGIGNNIWGLLTIRAGIIGLYTCYELLEAGIDATDIKIVAEFTPGDLSVRYTSPWAGAYFSAQVDDSILPYAKYTYSKLPTLRQKLGDCGVRPTVCIEYQNFPVAKEQIQALSYVDEVSTVTDKHEGIKYSGYTFNPPKFTQSIFEYVQLRGVEVIKRRVESLDDFKGLVFNCTGNGARDLADDDSCHPVRGQVVVVSAPGVKQCISYWSETESTYIIPRPESQMNEVVLGGFYQHGNGDLASYKHEVDDILKRVAAICPEMQQHFGNIMRVVTGLRPGRDGGPRVEREDHVVHVYGAGGCGYLMGLGMAHKAVGLALEYIDK